MSKQAIIAAGQRVFRDGFSIHHCPYYFGQERYEWWHLGYMEAREAALSAQA